MEETRENPLPCFAPREHTMILRTFPFIFIALFAISSHAANTRQDSSPMSTGTIHADHLEYLFNENSVIARGSVVMISSGALLEADEMTVNTASRTVAASGHVYIEDEGMSLFGDRADFNWDSSTGTIYNGYVISPPWRLWGREIIRLDPTHYRMNRAAITSCDLDPPHYHFRGRKGRYTHKKRATVYNGRFALEKDEIFYVPVYTRSLKDRRWTVRIDPGRSGRDGVYTKTMFGYPFTKNTYGRLYWDYFQNTGNGYGAEYDYFRSDINGSLYTYRIQDRLAQSERWNFRAGHWQQLKPRLALQANALFQSDKNFNNRYFRYDFEQVKQDLESDVALTYSHPLYSARVSAEHDEVYSPTRNKFVTSKTTLPHLNLQTSPLLIGSSVYATLSGNLRHEYQRPVAPGATADPILLDKDLFRQTADSSLSLSRTMPLTKRLTFVPAAGLSETWQSWRDLGSTIDRTDFSQGRVFTGLSFRHRVMRSLDYDLSHSYRVRWAPNQIERDHAALDQGTESNSLNLFFSYRPVTSFRARAGTGYDLRQADGETLRSIRRKISDPSAEFNYAPLRGLNFFYRQTVDLYVEGTGARIPQTSQFSFTAGHSEELRFNSGFSYNSASPGQLQVRHSAAFPFTKYWWADAGVQYSAKGPEKTRYNAVQFLEKYVILKRDLHCWRLRAEFRQRPGPPNDPDLDVNEVFFRIDLKTNVEARQALAAPEEEQYYPARERE